MRFALGLLVVTALVAPAGAQSSIPPSDRSVATAERSIVAYLAQDSVSDVHLGRLGMQKGTSPLVHALARTMVADHTSTAQQAMQVAAQIGDDQAKLEPDDAGVVTVARLARYSGSAFDRAWSQEAVELHKGDMSLLRNALAITTNLAVRQLETTALAVDEKHLRMAMRAQSAVGGG